jgi:hypothetical protein
VAVGSLPLGSAVDSLVAGLLAQAQRVTAAAGSLTGGGAGTALPPQATGAVATVSTQLATLTAQLQGLPTGAALAGLRTIGLDVSLGGAASEASFAPSPGTSSPPAVTPRAGDPQAGDPRPGDPRPGVEIPRSLPRTGGPHTLQLIALGLLLLVGGRQLVEVAKATGEGRPPPLSG